MTRDEAREIFSEVYDGTCDAEQRAAFERLLSEDEALKAEYDDFRVLLRAAATLGDEEPKDEPDLLRGVQSKLRVRSRGKFYRDRFAERSSTRFPLTALIGALRAALPQVKWRAHFHNTRNTGIANAYAAVEAGVRALDASCGGIGGCPFARAATGNIPTEDLIYMLHRMGLETGVDLPALLETSKWLQKTLDHAVPGMVVKAGLFPAGKTMENA